MALEEQSLYGHVYQQQQLQKYRNREQNHWSTRIALAKSLANDYVLPRLHVKPPGSITVVDVGCSIGTFAIEFARDGFSSYGVDFDPAALRLAKDLADEERVTARFLHLDVAKWAEEQLPAIDVAVCFDIFEHLHDDQLGALLQALRSQLSPAGGVIFHTYPNQYEYLLRRGLRLPLLPFRRARPATFDRVLKSYASMVDAALVAASGETHRERIRDTVHCNPTTIRRLQDILIRAGYEILLLESEQLYPQKKRQHRRFVNQPISKMNIYGVAVPRPAPPVE